MRHNSNARTRAMITDPVIPRSDEGAIRLCHHCQRTVYFARGFLRALAKKLDRAARWKHAPTVDILALAGNAAGSEAESYRAFCLARWPATNGAPQCPHCGATAPYNTGRPYRFSCSNADCRKQFSPTTGTVFASRKMGFAAMLMTLRTLANGTSVRQAAITSGRQAKTMFTVAAKTGLRSGKP